MWIQMLVAGVFSGVSAVMDMRSGKIKNQWTFICFLVASAFLIGSNNPNLFRAESLVVIPQGLGSQMLSIIIRACWPVLALYPVYLIRGVGAGDVKLFSVLSILYEPTEGLMMIFISLIFAAAAAFFRMVQRGEVWKRILCFGEYAVTCLDQREVVPYQSIGEEGSKLHVAPYIFLGVIAVGMWGIYGTH